MDSNTIKEIANQLGVGTDYLLNHLSEFASKWAAMQVAESGVVHYEHDDCHIASWTEFETIPRYCPWCGEDLTDK